MPLGACPPTLSASIETCSHFLPERNSGCPQPAMVGLTEAGEKEEKFSPSSQTKSSACTTMRVKSSSAKIRRTVLIGFNLNCYSPMLNL